MVKNWRILLIDTLTLVAVLIYPTKKALAQNIIPDNTLPNNSLVNSNGEFIEISGGTTAGNNLFHSFREFSVLNGQTAFFNNGLTIENILSRVTGNSISNIDGIIRASGTANLFLINPNGIIFGENASLDIGGSFLGSTAESILFENGEFNAVENREEPLLTVNVPIGLGLGDNPGEIVNRANLLKEERFGPQGIARVFPNFDPTIPLADKEIRPLIGLEVKPKQNLALIGGDVTLDDAGLTALGGKIQLGGLAAAGEVQLESDGNLRFPSNLSKSNVFLLNDSSIDVRGNGGGDIKIEAQIVEVKAGSTLAAGIRPFQGSPTTKGGDITINASNSVLFDGERSPDSPRGGNQFPTGAYNSLGLSLETESNGVLTPVTNGEGKVGNIEINTQQLDITNGARLVNITFGRGDAGNILIKAAGKVYLDNSGSSIFNTIFNERGNAGNIEIATKDLVLTNGAIISENLFAGQGDLGKIIIHATENVLLDGENIAPVSGLVSATSIFNTVNDFGVGNGNAIEITTKNLSLTNGAQLFTSTVGQGNAGNVFINAGDRVKIDRAGIASEVDIGEFGGRGQGDGGTISINTNELNIINNSFLSVSSKADGKVGQILVEANSLTLNNKGNILAQTNFSNSDIEVNSTENNIILNLEDNLVLNNDSFISARAFQKADGGNLNIDARFIIAFPNQNNDIIANAQQGRGGEINIVAESLFGIEERPLNDITNDINASSDVGLDGDISIDIPDVDPLRGLTELPANVIDASQQISQACSLQDGKVGRFIATGRGGLPLSPNEPLRSTAVMTDWVDEPTETTGKVNNQLAKNLVEDEFIPGIVEAQGWIINDRGNIELVNELSVNPPVSMNMPCNK